MKKNKQLQDYQQAVWDYVLEHCEITQSGVYFIKFHTKNKKQFEGHIFNRLDGYHREDPIEKEVTGIAKQTKHKKDKLDKKYTYKVAKQKRMELIKWNGRVNKANKWLKPILNFYGKNILKIQ